ncbi:centromere protein S [Platysternon megacephalum]|uniref:Centromere protein S n=1 Tax=Platysternon megacephalum TaxID=55544 RepID=A0A4D9EXZ4_9SAUR|nr:centromere protein S [Platysternon megacephalum]
MQEPKSTRSFRKRYPEPPGKGQIDLFAFPVVSQKRPFALSHLPLTKEDFASATRVSAQEIARAPPPVSAERRANAEIQLAISLMQGKLTPVSSFFSPLCRVWDAGCRGDSWPCRVYSPLWGNNTLPIEWAHGWLEMWHIGISLPPPPVSAGCWRRGTIQSFSQLPVS